MSQTLNRPLKRGNSSIGFYRARRTRRITATTGITGQTAALIRSLCNTHRALAAIQGHTLQLANMRIMPPTVNASLGRLLTQMRVGRILTLASKRAGYATLVAAPIASSTAWPPQTAYIRTITAPLNARNVIGRSGAFKGGGYKARVKR